MIHFENFKKDLAFIMCEAIVGFILLFLARASSGYLKLGFVAINIVLVSVACWHLGRVYKKAISFIYEQANMVVVGPDEPTVTTNLTNALIFVCLASITSEIFWITFIAFRGSLWFILLLIPTMLLNKQSEAYLRNAINAAKDSIVIRD